VKLKHKINHGWAPDRTDPVWAERVEREAEATTAATERAYRKAQARLAKAVEQVEHEVKRKHSDRRRLKRLQHAVEARRQELLVIEGMMRAVPASAQHRGKGSHRSVPSGRTI